MSIASEPPPDVRKTLAPSIPESVATREASSSAGGLEKNSNMCQAASSRICFAAASAISVRPCPDVAVPEAAGGVEVGRCRRGRRRWSPPTG